jgi:hypothetical protein
MNRAWNNYAVLVVTLLIACVAGIRIMTRSPVDAALARLGKGTREFETAREQILLGAGNPSRVLARFALDPRTGRQARLQALAILADAAQRMPSDTAAGLLAPLLSDTSGTVRIATLRAVEALADEACAVHLHGMLAATLDSAEREHCILAMLSVQRELGGRAADALARDDSTALDSLVRLSYAMQAGRQMVASHDIAYHTGRGDSAVARALYLSLGAVEHWWAASPFTFNRATEYYREFGPEQQQVFDSTRHFAAPGGKTVHWRRVHYPNPMARDQGCQVPLDVPPRSTSYFFTYVDVPQECEAFVMVGSWEGVRVWFNGEHVRTHKRLNMLVPDLECIRVRLRRGPNELLVRPELVQAGWAFTARVVDFDGDTIPGCRMMLRTDPSAPAPL